MARSTGRRWRQLTVLLHIFSSVGWMTMALTLLALLALAGTSRSSRGAGRWLLPRCDQPAEIRPCSGRP